MYNVGIPDVVLLVGRPLELLLSPLMYTQSIGAVIKNTKKLLESHSYGLYIQTETKGRGRV